MNINHMSLPIDLRYTQKEKLLEVLDDLSINKMNFYDDIWVCDKKTPNFKIDSKGKYSVYFQNVPDKYRALIRYYALAMFKDGSRVSTVYNNVRDIKTFFIFLHIFHNDILMEKVDYTIINRYKKYLNEKYESSNTKHSKWSSVSNFYIKMRGTDGHFENNILGRNPFPKNQSNKEKYIPKYIINQLDELCKSETLPLEVRVLYWIMNFIPSRIGELIDLPINCIKDIKNGWTLTLNMRKQNGGYYEPELRVLRFKNESKEATYLYDLIKAQQKIAINLQEKLKDHQKGYFFTYKKKGRYSVQKDENGMLKYFEYSNKIIVASYTALSASLFNICERYGIKSENGEIYHISSHCLRHNGITDRIIDGGFEIDDIKGITHQKNSTMITKNYLHISEANSLDLQKKVKSDSGNNYDKFDENTIYFKGRIMNINEMLEKRLLRDIRKHKVKLGICSDIGSCKKKYKCLEDCKYYIPDYRDLPYFENEIKQWQKKVEYYEKQNIPMQKENAEYNLKIHKKIRDRLVESVKGGNKDG